MGKTYIADHIKKELVEKATMVEPQEDHDVVSFVYLRDQYKNHLSSLTRLPAPWLTDKDKVEMEEGVDFHLLTNPDGSFSYTMGIEFNVPAVREDGVDINAAALKYGTRTVKGPTQWEQKDQTKIKAFAAGAEWMAKQLPASPVSDAVEQDAIWYEVYDLALKIYNSHNYLSQFVELMAKQYTLTRKTQSNG